MSSAEVVRWLAGSTPAAPDSLLHPADVFPLATISNPPSSTASDRDSDDGARLASRNIASLVHPPTPTTMAMEDQASAAHHARRRSSSLAGPAQHADRKHRRRHSDHILEEGEDKGSASDSDASSGRTDSDHLELDNMSADGLQDDEETGLTRHDRRRRRRRKRRNTLLENRVVPDDVRLSKEEEKLADQNLIQSMLINAVLIGLWYEHACEADVPTLIALGTSFPSPSPCTTSGCSRRIKATARHRTSFPFRSSPPVCTWWSSLRLRRSCCS
jgi:solute carrier family 35 protein C2